MMSVNQANMTRGQYARISGYLVLAEVLLGNLCEAKKLATHNSVSPLFRSWITFREGDFEAARELILEQLDYSRKIGNAWNLWASLSNLIEVLTKSGDYEQASASLTEALKLQTPENQYCELRIRPQAALLALEMDRPTEAENDVKICRSILERGEDWLGLTGAVERA